MAVKSPLDYSYYEGMIPNKKELLPAEIARQISENYIWNNIIDAVDKAVKTGKTDIIYNDVIPISIENKLKELGYIVEPYEIHCTRDIIGYIVQW